MRRAINPGGMSLSDKTKKYAVQELLNEWTFPMVSGF
jgi:hypothetical protein